MNHVLAQLQRSWQNQKSFCQNQNYSLAAIETEDEENAIYAT